MILIETYAKLLMNTKVFFNLQKMGRIMEKKSKNKKSKNTKTKKGYLKAVKTEMSKVVWPKRKEVIKYTIATVVFIIIFVGFFLLLNLGLSVIKGVFN